MEELQFYAPWIPFFELGEDVDVGPSLRQGRASFGTL